MQIQGKGLECSPFGSGECEEQQSPLEGQEGGLGWGGEGNLKQMVSSGGGGWGDGRWGWGGEAAGVGGEAGERDRDGCHSTCEI